MQGFSSACRRFGLLLISLALLTSTGCSTSNSKEPVRAVQIQQAWELQPGDAIGSHKVTGSLGDISLELNGDAVRAPFDGQVQPNTIQGCVIFSTPEVPAYLFRLCGLNNPRLGQLQQGDVIGSGDYLQFAALRRQPDGRWAMVEPARDILERTLR